MRVKPILKMCACAISFCTLFLYSGCGALNQGTFTKDETGAYTRHFWSCGPKAISDVMHQLKKSYHSDVEISREIQSNGNIRRFTLSVFNERAMAITWPSEIKKYFHKRDLDLVKANFNSLTEKDTAIVLVKNGLTYHWITFPTYTKEYIQNFFGTSTGIVESYLIKKRAAN
jgi:hypothetical protein